MITVSVILPVFNGSKTIRASVDSVLAQTYTNFELIIIDDGSSDNTLDILSSLRDPRIHVIPITNHGVSYARNVGMHHAVGAYLSFIDADDLWLPSKLELQIAACNGIPNAMCFGRIRKFVQDPTSSQPCHNIEPVLCFLPLSMSLLANNSLPIVTSFMSRSIYEKVGTFDTSKQGPEDWDYWIRAKDLANYVFVHKVVALYRISSAGITSNHTHYDKQELELIHQYCLDSASVPSYIKKLALDIYWIKKLYRKLATIPSRKERLIALFQELLLHEHIAKLPLVFISAAGRYIISIYQDIGYRQSV